MQRRLLALLLTLLVTAPLPASPREGRFALGLELGGSLSVAELLPIEFKPAPDAEWGILVPVPLYPGNGLDVGAFAEYYPLGSLGLRCWWGTQIPVQPMAEPPTYIRDVTGDFHRFGLDVFACHSEGKLSLDVGLGLFYVLANYEFLFNDFTVPGDDWETVTGETWTLGLTPQLGFEFFLGESLALGGRLLAPISLVSDDGNEDTEEQGFGNYKDGLELRLMVKYYL